MSDKTGGNFSVETYISKQETLLVEHIRRSLQAETKIAILESGLQELYKKNEELTEQINLQRNTSDQAISGLQATTLERDKFQNKTSELEQVLQNRTRDFEQRLNETNTERNRLTSQLNASNNKIANLENEINQLNNRVQVAGNDYTTLKENYNRVLAALEEANAKVERFESLNSKKKPKKVSTQESEWVDGEYKVST